MIGVNNKTRCCVGPRSKANKHVLEEDVGLHQRTRGQDEVNLRKKKGKNASLCWSLQRSNGTAAFQRAAFSILGCCLTFLPTITGAKSRQTIFVHRELLMETKIMKKKQLHRINNALYFWRYCSYHAKTGEKTLITVSRAACVKKDSVSTASVTWPIRFLQGEKRRDLRLWQSGCDQFDQNRRSIVITRESNQRRRKVHQVE